LSLESPTQYPPISQPPLLTHPPTHTPPPADLKPALSRALNQILQPVRDHFVKNPEAAALLKQVRGYKVTR